MPNDELRRNIFWFVGTVDLIILDLLTKWAAYVWLKESKIILPDVLELKLSQNPGVAFSIPIPNTIMIWVTPFLLVAIIWLIVRSCNLQDRIAKTALMLLIAGGLGNFLNRIWHGAVVDFIDFSFWPSFNLADIYLTVGVFLLIAFYGKITIKPYGAGN